METTNATQQPKRPLGMTILLVLSFLNAILNIFSSMIMFVGTPMIAEMVKTGQLEETMTPFLTTANEEMRTAMMDSMTALASIKPIYYLLMLVLFVVSLVGVIKMLKTNKSGLHFYAISQILMLIVSSIYKYPLMHPSPFMTDLLLTCMFIAVYYLYFKRMEMENMKDKPNNLEE